MKEKIVLIGTGIQAEQFIYLCGAQYEIEFYLDKNPRNYYFLNRISVFEYDSFNFNNVNSKIVIATEKSEYLKIADDLKRYGLREFQDFFYYEAMYKKMAIFWGNCQIRSFAEELSKYPEFTSEYWIYPMPNIDDSHRRFIDDNVFSSCDLFVYQSVKKETNGLYYSSDYMLSRVKSTAPRIRIPNLYKKGFGFFPQSKSGAVFNIRVPKLKFIVNSDCYDSYIDDNYNGSNTEELIASIINDDIYSKDYICERFNHYMDVIRNDDKDNDIKISEYIYIYI